MKNIPYKSGWDMSPKDLEYLAIQNPDQFFEILYNDQDSDLMFAKDRFIPILLKVYTDSKSTKEIRNFFIEVINTWCGDILRLQYDIGFNKINELLRPYCKDNISIRNLLEKVESVYNNHLDTKSKDFYNMWYGVNV
jgi:hypothetical protein